MIWEVPGGGGGRQGHVSWRGLRRSRWQEGALKSKPGQIGKGLHPAHRTQRRAPGGSGVPHIKCWAVGSPAPCTSVLKCFSFCKETGGGREEEPRAQEGVPVFGNTERQISLMTKNEC